MSKRKEKLNEHYEIEILPIGKGRYENFYGGSKADNNRSPKYRLPRQIAKLKELLLESLRRGQVKCVSSRILFPISGINSVCLTFFCFLGG